jgi:hypothetical protein
MTHHNKHRQVVDPPLPTNIAGVTNSAVTVGTEAATQSSLAIDTAASPVSPASATVPPLAPGATTPSPPPSAPVTSASTNAMKSIPMSTVIAVCMGAFIVVSLVIVVAVWMYKRAGKRSRRSRNNNNPLYRKRNARGEAERSRSRQERWGKLDDGADELETHYPPTQTREMDKDYTSLSMFKKSSPSVRSIGSFANTTAESRYEFEPGPFAQYHPQAGALANEPPARNFLGRLDVVSPMSWGTETIGKDSHLSSSSSNAVKAMRTPVATSHGELHRWESAEVEHFYEDESENGGVREGRARSTRSARSSLFEERRARRRSPDNPFFSGSRDMGRRSSSRSRSRTRSEKTSISAVTNPFSDPDSSVPELPRHPPESVRSGHSTGGSFNSSRALQSLIAALEVTPDPEQEGLRISTSPSALSEDADRTSMSAFPLPPTSLPP